MTATEEEERGKMEEISRITGLPHREFVTGELIVG